MVKKELFTTVIDEDAVLKEKQFINFFNKPAEIYSFIIDLIEYV